VSREEGQATALGSGSAGNAALGSLIKGSDIHI